eukprot:886709-Pleurochrysis_carterae.AAC.6
MSQSRSSRHARQSRASSWLACLMYFRESCRRPARLSSWIILRGQSEEEKWNAYITQPKQLAFNHVLLAPLSLLRAQRSRAKAFRTWKARGSPQVLSPAALGSGRLLRPTSSQGSRVAPNLLHSTVPTHPLRHLPHCSSKDEGRPAVQLLDTQFHQVGQNHGGLLRHVYRHDTRSRATTVTVPAGTSRQSLDADVASIVQLAQQPHDVAGPGWNTGKCSCSISMSYTPTVLQISGRAGKGSARAATVEGPEGETKTGTKALEENRGREAKDRQESRGEDRFCLRSNGNGEACLRGKTGSMGREREA